MIEWNFVTRPLWVSWQLWTLLCKRRSGDQNFLTSMRLQLNIHVSARKQQAALPWSHFCFFGARNMINAAWEKLSCWQLWTVCVNRAPRCVQCRNFMTYLMRGHSSRILRSSSHIPSQRTESLGINELDYSCGCFSCFYRTLCINPCWGDSHPTRRRVNSKVLPSLTKNLTSSNKFLGLWATDALSVVFWDLLWVSFTQKINEKYSRAALQPHQTERSGAICPLSADCFVRNHLRMSGLLDWNYWLVLAQQD